MKCICIHLCSVLPIVGLRPPNVGWGAADSQIIATVTSERRSWQPESKDGSSIVGRTLAMDWRTRVLVRLRCQGAIVLYSDCWLFLVEKFSCLGKKSS